MATLIIHVSCIKAKAQKGLISQSKSHSKKYSELGLNTDYVTEKSMFFAINFFTEMERHALYRCEAHCL